MTIRKLLIVLAVFYQSFVVAQVKEGDTYPEWSEGYMDIHHINTGRGECVFAILPDGTTIMIDAGETGPSPRVTEARPNDTKSSRSEEHTSELQSRPQLVCR